MGSYCALALARYATHRDIRVAVFVIVHPPPRTGRPDPPGDPTFGECTR